jgi:acetylxylan esterase
MHVKAVVPLLAGLAAAAALEERQSCPKIHVFGARETTAPAGYGTSYAVVQAVLNAYPGSATAEAIQYPACGGQASCGGASYDSSAQQGTTAVVNAVTSLNSRCPDTQIVLIGYSQVRSVLPSSIEGFPAGSPSKMD